MRTISRVSILTSLITKSNRQPATRCEPFEQSRSQVALLHHHAFRDAFDDAFTRITTTIYLPRSPPRSENNRFFASSCTESGTSAEVSFSTASINTFESASRPGKYF